MERKLFLLAYLLISTESLYAPVRHAKPNYLLANFRKAQQLRTAHFHFSIFLDDNNHITLLNLNNIGYRIDIEYNILYVYDSMGYRHHGSIVAQHIIPTSRATRFVVGTSL